MICRIKKLFLVLGVIFFSTLICGCVENIKTNTWFSKEILQTFQIQGLPQIEDENAILDKDDVQNEYTIYFNYTLDDINKYVENVLNYLVNNDQIYHLSGFDRVETLDDESIPIYKEIGSNFNFDNNEYRFAFSTTSQTSEKYGLTGLNEPIIISLSYATEPFIYENCEYSSIIKLYKFSGFISIYKKQMDIPPDETSIFPQTIIVNGITYNMIVDINQTLVYELDELIGHIIREEALEQYKLDYPNLIPVVNNYVKNEYTKNMIEIYTVKNKNPQQFLAIKLVLVGDIVNTEIFEVSKLILSQLFGL